MIILMVVVDMYKVIVMDIVNVKTDFFTRNTKKNRNFLKFTKPYKKNFEESSSI